MIDRLCKTWILIYLVCSVSCQQNPAQSSSQENGSLIDVIAFGSCSKQDYDQVLWNDVVSAKPDLWIWLGDNIYGDTQDMDLIRSMYLQQKQDPGYQKLMRSSKIIGTWDDHDYGLNDGGKEFEKKEESKIELFRFLEVPAGSPARAREGVYQSYVFGEVDQQIKIILLDCRTFRDKQLREGNRYVQNADGDILGEAQWNWLEAQLSGSQAAIHIIGGGIQFLSYENRFEKWANFPTARNRLFEVIKRTKPNNLIMISGDRHIAEISKIELEGYVQPLYDITSSGLTHSYHVYSGEPNKYRVGEVTKDLNFGLLRIDWTNPTPNIIIEIRGDEGSVYQTLNLGL